MENINQEIFRTVSDYIIDCDFGQAQYEFFEKCKSKIEADEENKLEYTPIFNEYVQVMEQFVDFKLKEKYSDEQITAFYEEFKVNFKNYEASNKDSVEVLFGLIDFEKFKEAVLNYKKGIDEGKASAEQAMADAEKMKGLK